jgi:hypothetical protein
MISKDQLVAAVRARAAATPNQVYDSRSGRAKYAPDHRNPAGCLLGAALTDCGLPDGVLRMMGAVPWGVARVSGGHTVDLEVVLRFIDADAWGDPWLRAVQYAQDRVMSWREAVYFADSKSSAPARTSCPCGCSKTPLGPVMWTADVQPLGPAPRVIKRDDVEYLVPAGYNVPVQALLRDRASRLGKWAADGVGFPDTVPSWMTDEMMMPV